MRLSGNEISIIKKTVRSRDPEAQVYLFGSRTDDSKRGGDIDLLFVSDVLREEDKWEIQEELYNKMGEQRIDLLIADKSGIQDKTFFRIAYQQGILL